MTVNTIFILILVALLVFKYVNRKVDYSDSDIPPFKPVISTDEDDDEKDEYDEISEPDDDVEDVEEVEKTIESKNNC